MDDSEASRYTDQNESSVINQSMKEQHMSFAGQPGHAKGGLSIDMDNDLQIMNDSGICNINDFSRGSFENHVRNLSIGYDQMGNGRAGNIGSFVGSLVDNPILEEDDEFTNSPDSPERNDQYQRVSPSKLDDEQGFDLSLREMQEGSEDDEADGLPQIKYYQDSQHLTESQVMSQFNDSAQIVEGEWSDQLPEVNEISQDQKDENQELPMNNISHQHPVNGGGWDT